VSPNDAHNCTALDIDFVEYGRWGDPIALFETAVDIGQSHKPTTVTRKLAERADIPAFLVFYTLSDSQNPVDSRVKDCTSFRVKRVTPDPWGAFKVFSPDGWAKALVRLRESPLDDFDDLAEEAAA
jgi:hypothetical protein